MKKVVCRQVEFFLISALAAMAISQSFAAEPKAIVCTKEAGRIIGPFVPTADIAREIYDSIAQGHGEKLKPNEEVAVSDLGDRWAVYPKNTTKETWGGGGFELEINKCDGAVKASYAR